MPLNLISDSWIPVHMKDGSRRVIRPDEIADPDIAFPDWPRADLNIACLELLIGLVYLADPPVDDEDWDVRQAPDAVRLGARLAALAPAFSLGGDGPRFLQDLEPLQGEANPPDMLFIDSAGTNTAKNNADLMVRRGRYPALEEPLAAMALYAFQAHAPSGGAGNRTSMRGGGPMVTLVDPGQGLWALVWSNVPNGTPHTANNLPWMQPTRVSDDGKPPTYPPQMKVPPPEVFFGMPRRLRLVFDDSDHVTGVFQRPYGTNYAGWDHPLSPYYRMKAGGERLPQHPRAGVFGYRNWLGIVIAAPQAVLRERAACVRDWLRRTLDDVPARILVGGWSMDNMKPMDFTSSSQPLIALDADGEHRLAGMVEAAESFAFALRGALASVVAEGEAREVLREDFFIRTQPAFEQRLADMAGKSDPDAVAGAWLSDMRRAAMDIFDTAALPGLDQRGIADAHKIVSARSILLAAFSGRTKQGRDAFARLQIEPLDKKVEEPA